MTATRSTAEIYDKAFYDYTSGAAADAAASILPLLAEVLVPESVVDIGCGAAAWARSASQIFEADVLAVDGPWNTGLSASGLPFLHADLEDRITIERRFDLAICLEVLEHVSAVQRPRSCRRWSTCPMSCCSRPRYLTSKVTIT